MRLFISFILIILFSPALLAQTKMKVPNDEPFKIEKNEAINAISNHSKLNKNSKYYNLEKEGQTAIENKKWDSAIKIYKELIRLDGKNADYHYKYGSSLGFKLIAGQKITAIFYIGKVKHEFLTAAKLDKNHIDARWALIETYLRLPFFLGGSTEKAKYYANQLEKISEIDGLLAKGRIAKYNKEYGIAEVYFTRAVNFWGSKNSYYRLAELYDVYLKKPNKALTVLNTAIYKYPSDLRFYYQYGKIAIHYNLNECQGKLYLNYFIAHYTPDSPIALDDAYRLLKS